MRTLSNSNKTIRGSQASKKKREHTFCVGSNSTERRSSERSLYNGASGAIRSREDILLRKIAEGDQEAFMELYELYADRLFLFCRRMMGDRDKAKDAMQNALIKIYERAHQYQENTNPSAWIFRLARNVCIDLLRAEKEHDQIDETVLPVQQPRQHDVVLQEALTSEIEALPTIYREAIVLRDVQGHSYKEIAEIVDEPLSTIKFRIFKARDILRERLQPYLGSDETV